MESPQFISFQCPRCGSIRSFRSACCGIDTVVATQRRSTIIDVRDALPEAYTYGCLVGVGGFADVHLVRDRRTNEAYALKVLRHDLLGDSALELNFIREMEAWIEFGIKAHVVSALNAVRLLDGRLALLMEYVDGSSLSKLIGAGALDLSLAMKVATDVARGMLQLHNNGIVHGDLHPGNVLVSHDQEGIVSDFGFVTAVERQVQSVAKPIVRNPAYMAPELVAGAGPTPASDIYSFGLILYQMLVGCLPYSNEIASDSEKMQAWHLNMDAHLATCFPAIEPQDAKIIITSCLRRRPEDRCRDFRTIWESLKCICDQEGYTGTYEHYLNPMRDTAEEMLRVLTPLITNRSEVEGLALQELGNHIRAVAKFEEALTYNPKSATLFWNKGNSCWLLERHEQALACFESARSLDPSIYGVGLRIAFCLFALRRVDVAFHELNTCIDSLEPEEKALALNARLRIACLIGEYETAWGDFAELEGLADAAIPTFDIAQVNGSLVDYADVIIEFLDQKMHQLNVGPMDVRAFGQYAKGCLEVFRALEIEKERNPQNVEIHLLEARVCKRLHLQGRAGVAIQNALAIDRSHRGARIARAWHMLQLAFAAIVSFVRSPIRGYRESRLQGYRESRRT